MSSSQHRLRAGLVILACALLAACGTANEASLPDPTASAEPEGQPQHIVDLVDQHLVTARITGIGMDALALRVRNTSAQPQQVEIPAGTYFVAQNELVQNMVARHPATVVVEPFAEVEITLEAACASVRRAEPGNTDTFGIVRTSEQPELGQIIEKLNTVEVLYPVEQAAIWIVTDDASYDDLGMLVGGSRFGEALIGEDEAVRAMLLVNEAGIDISKYGIWSEVDALRPGLTQSDLIAWLEERESASPSSTQAAGAPAPPASGEQISQWAREATSDYESTPGSAAQAAGAPDSSGCGQQPTTWTTGDANPGATLTLRYDRMVIPSRIVIHESYNPGAIFYVEVRDQYSAAARFQVYQGNSTLLAECPREMVIDVQDVDVGVNVIEINVDQSLAWTAIDAVELIGTTP